jgi:GNAT superfamily N-acetyltransferase
MSALPELNPTTARHHVAARPPALTMRELVPGDEPLIAALFDGLSEQSRYQRFHAAKPTLSARELSHLAATDGRDHIAFVALDPHGKPLGIARGVRLVDCPTTVEIAAEVLDDVQRRGIGSALIARVARRAAGVGVEHLAATVLSETQMTRTLRRRGWKVRSFDGPTTTLDIELWSLLTAPTQQPAP